jgi:hypothetical protein
METKVLNNQAEFMIKFPDGTFITGKPRFEVYKNTILKIGIDRVASFAQVSKLKRYGQPYINKIQNKILSEGGYKQEYIGGYYVVSDFSALNMSRFLRDLSKELDLGLTIYNPCKTPLAN